MVVAKSKVPADLSPRCFVFALRSRVNRIAALEDSLRTSATSEGAHFHGVAVLDRRWFFRQQANVTPFAFATEEGATLARFCAAVLDTIQSMRMMPADMSGYLGL